MALSFIWNLRNFWPFSKRKLDDLGISEELVRKLPIPDHTKQFVFAFFEPESQSVVYVLSAQSLSERSASDAECLIKALCPDGVVAQVGHVGQAEVEPQERGFSGGVDDVVPTSTIAVLKRCFVNKVNKEKYESAAGNFVLREIFGVSFEGQVLAAKKAAEEVGSSFLILESPFVKYSSEESSPDAIDGGKSFSGMFSSLAPRKVGSVVSSSLKRVSLNDAQSQMVKMVSSYMNVSAVDSNSSSNSRSVVVKPESSYVAPSFAQPIYPLLEDLHNLFSDIPSMGRALAHAQKMLSDVNRGEVVDSQIVAEVYSFRIAAEGLRIALNDAGRLPAVKTRSSGVVEEVEFSELPLEDKSQVLFARALRVQAKKFKTTVAVVDASALVGLRKHWNTPVPKEVDELVGQIGSDDDGENFNQKRRLLHSSPVVAVGAGATAVLGVSSFSKAVPASTLVKVMTFKFPASLKILLSQTQKAITLVFGKTLGPSKLVAPGFTSSVGKSSTLKAALSAEKIRAVTHGFIASAEKSSISAMKTSFYQIMRNRQARPIGLLPWATFGCSIATCTGLLVYGDGIECAAESLPSATSIASLGRGIQSLQKASQAVSQTDSARSIQKSIESLMYRLKRVKGQ